MDNRYQYQNKVVKFYRWLRWMPIYYFKAMCQLVKWVLWGAPSMEDFNRRETFSLILKTYRSLGHYKMGYYFHMHEVLSDAFIKGKGG